MFSVLIKEEMLIIQKHEGKGQLSTGKIGKGVYSQVSLLRTTIIIFVCERWDPFSLLFEKFHIVTFNFNETLAITFL